MAKFRLTKRKTRKAAIAALCAVAVTCTSLAAACQPNDSGSTDEDTTRAEDTSTLTNGSFEFFSVPDDATYLIKNVQDWSRSGDSSGTMSGILDTSESNWKAITASDLADKLDNNNDLLATDDKYVNYNGMKSSDIPYKDTYAAKLEANAVKDDKIINKNDLTYAEYLGITVTVTDGEDGAKTYKYGDKDVYYNDDDGDFYFDTEYTQPVRKDVIANPETHYGSYKEKDGKHYLGDKEIYVGEDGTYYKDEDKEYSEGNVLMIHNYPTDSKYNGIQQYYTSTSVTLEARTAAKISVWVKTSNLKFDKGYSLMDEQDRGAFIEVVQTVSGTTIDAFSIKAINTEKIIKDNKDDKDFIANYTSNGWLQYNIYVNSCDFASSTVQLRLGLGKNNGETCTGYAFFDDVTVEKELDIEKFEDYSEKIKPEIYSEDHKTYCTLSSEGDDKVFYADRAVRGAYADDNRHSKHFNYLIDLASEAGTNGYSTLELNSSNTTAGLTNEEEDKKSYASAEQYGGKVYNLNTPTDKYELYKKATARPTDKDLLGLFTSSDNFSGKGIQDNHADALYSALLGDDVSFKTLPTYDEASKMIVMLSVWGAAYTTTVQDSTFTLDAGKQMIVSFWIKTSDMKGKTAATIYIHDVKDTEKENVQELNIDSTNIKTDIGDEKDIYNGWVQCFFFVQNNTKEDNKTFQIDFCFGNTSIISATSYDYGWVALANMQTLEITEEVYKITTTASYTQKFQFSTDEKEKTNKKFAESLGTYDITKEIALPDGYNGVNGASSSVSSEDYSHNYDVWNTNHVAGLINRDNFYDDDGNPVTWNNNEVLKSFSSSAKNWDEVFGKDCYQPLIIVNNLRRYADNAHANEDTYKNYYVLAEDEYEGDFVEDNSYRKYRKVKDDEEFKDDITYYSFKEVVNYGFVGANKTVSSSSTEIITVKVMVSGNAKAYIYLVDTTTREIMSYSTPAYTFWYDNEANVLDDEFDKDWSASERDKHTVYDKQDNGLYKDKDGNYVANLYNLKKIYQKEKLATYYYKENGEIKEYRGAKCVDGVDYYTDEAATIPAPHRLCNSDDTPIYEYKNGNYYYIVNGKVTDTKVGNFDEQYARYNYTDETFEDMKYFVEVGNTDGQWVTVNFVVKTGNNSKPYRLELWSGKRDETGADGDETTKDDVNGAVAFDYSSYSITSSNYESILRTDTDSYENTIKAKYEELLAGHEEEFEIDATIKDYEELAEEILGKDNKDLNDLKASYTALYYTYSLYDTQAYIPFNKEVAKDGETDYDYTAPESESLAFFRNTVEKNGKIASFNMFIDYSAVEQQINKADAPTDNSSDDDKPTANAGDFWLQLASILLVVVLLFVLLALVARIIIKRIMRNRKLKDQSKNVYRKRERYMRKLHIESEDTEEVENPALQNNEAEEPAEEVTEEAPVEEAPTEVTEEVTEAPEAPVEEAPAEEKPVEEVKEAPAETTETPSENSEDKPE